MLAKRIIPCLDVRHGKVVKGVNFLDVKDVGDPVELAREYNRQGADELVFYDIVASHEGRGAILDVIRRTAENVFIPFCVGGGVSTADDFKAILRAGADKVSVNSSAVKNPSLINEAADIFGCQCVVLGIDTKRSAHTESGYTVCVNGGRIDTGRDLIAWAAEAERRGAGEICLNSMDTDGVRGGFDIPMLKAVCGTVKIPVIASGGAGKLTDFGDAFEKTGCSAALAASLFHFGELTIAEVKENCRLRGIGVR